METRYNVGIVKATVIRDRNVHLQHVRAQEEAVVDGLIADGVEDVMVDEEGDVQVPKDQLMPRWYYQS